MMIVRPKPPRQLLLFRHGETDWNAQGRFQGQLDVPMNDRGRAQARELAERLADAGLHALFSSDLSRARETAEIVAARLGIPLHLHPGLREAHLGEVQGMTAPEIRRALGEEAVQRWRSGDVTDADVAFPGGESGAEIRGRALAALHELMARYPYPTVGISSHGGVIRRLMQSLLPEGSPAVPIPNAVLYRLSYHEEAKQLVIADAAPALLAD
jgi:2,3-bisphosphoglycerate-dependent phosphoglycerate mutase